MRLDPGRVAVRVPQGQRDRMDLDAFDPHGVSGSDVWRAAARVEGG
jgi:hypothetical protein